jgi:hypothetical protein
VTTAPIPPTSSRAPITLVAARGMRLRLVLFDIATSFAGIDESAGS